MSHYESGLINLLAMIGQKHPRYVEALGYQTRLQENINRTRRHGNAKTRRTERAEIVGQLNQLTLAVLGRSFNTFTAPPPTQPPVNTPPEIVSVGASPINICPGETTKLIAVATDADGDSLQYVWLSTIGTISDKKDTPTGSEATYQASTTTGADVITLRVLDGQGEQDQRQTNVKVNDNCPAAVNIVSPDQTLSCSHPSDIPDACQFRVEGTTESVVSHSQYDDLRLYVLVFPERY
ncbi:MAG: hypothetical protein GY796_08340 [Chloroflexi bacterium]|nr:hypothetical protein [Chloroflexota bacterium]